MQQDVIKEMVEQGHYYEEIQKELQIQFGEGSLRRSSIYGYIQKAKLGLPLVEDSYNTENRYDEQLLISIQREINNDEFFSTRSLAQRLHCSQNLIYRYLTYKLHRIYKHTKWIPHSLNSEEKKRRKDMSIELFHVLESCKENNYRNIITGDQSWFIYSYPPKGAWVLEDDNPPVFPKSDQFIEKMMITIIWGVYGTYILDELPQGERYNSRYFIDHILQPLTKQKQTILNSREEQPIYLHLDNCKVHNSKVTMNEMQISGFQRAPHPPYSPDLAPSDFFLFGYIKGKLGGRSFDKREDLYEEISSILNSISEAERIKVFDEWMHRCYWVHSHEGTYFDK